MSKNIHISAEFTIEKDNVKQFKKLIKQMSNMVQANEPNTSVYEAYFSEDGTKCMVHETYTDSKAVLSHNDSMASKTILPRIFNIAILDKLDVYGNPNKELKNLLAGFNSQIFNLYAGFNREFWTDIL